MRGEALASARAPSGVGCIRIQRGIGLTSPSLPISKRCCPCQGGAQLIELVTSTFSDSSHSEQTHKSTVAASQKCAISSSSSGAVIISQRFIYFLGSYSASLQTCL